MAQIQPSLGIEGLGEHEHLDPIRSTYETSGDTGEITSYKTPGTPANQLQLQFGEFKEDELFTEKVRAHGGVL